MVTRSGSGTGVVVSLVVFVLCTVFLLVLNIVFYSAQADASQARAEASDALARYVTREQRNRERIKALEAQANPARGESVVRQLLEDHENLMQYVSGSAQTSFDALRRQFQEYGVTADDSVRSALQQVSRELRQQSTEIENLKDKLAAREQEIAELDEEKQRLAQDHERELEQVTGQIAEYRQEAQDYRAQLEEVQAEYHAAIDRHRDQYEGRISRLENEKDALFQERSILKERLDQLEEILSVNRLRVQDPATLVDATIVDTAGRDDVYINRGKNDRIVLGMTFEVYDNAAALQDVDRLSGRVPRGKASLQVTQVRESTSKCKITRAVPGRPVVRGDVVANAVYDPQYVFKFMVHGKFDVDGDGTPSEAEADFIRSLIVDWGGAVVSGETLPGDLDFLVLGIEPPRPLPLPANATDFQIEDWVRRRRAHEEYRELFRQASEAQIPVLNANRFFILTGYAG